MSVRAGYGNLIQLWAIGSAPLFQLRMSSIRPSEPPESEYDKRQANRSDAKVLEIPDIKTVFFRLGSRNVYRAWHRHVRSDRWRRVRCWLHYYSRPDWLRLA